MVVGELGPLSGLGRRSRVGKAGVLDLITNLKLGLNVTAFVVKQCRDIQLRERRAHTFMSGMKNRGT